GVMALITTIEAARMLGITRGRMSQLITGQKIMPAKTIKDAFGQPIRLYFRKNDIERYARTRRVYRKNVRQNTQPDLKEIRFRLERLTADVSAGHIGRAEPWGGADVV